MKLQILISMLTLGALHAQNVTEVPTNADALASWLSRSTTIEVQAPAGATSYAVSVGPDGPDGFAPAVASHLRTPAKAGEPTLQLIIVPPDQPGGNNVCDRQGLAGIFIIQTGGAIPGSPNYLPFCAPYPAGPAPSNELAIVIDEGPTDLGEWQPIYLHAWQAQDNTTAETDQSMMFTVQVSFNDDNTTTIPEARRLSPSEVLELESVKEHFRR